MKPNYFMRGYCPLIEEFHIRNIIGCVEKKQWIFGDTFLMAAASRAVTLSEMTGGLITAASTKVNRSNGVSEPDFKVLVQAIGNSLERPYIDTKTTAGFTLRGDTGKSVHVVVMVNAPLVPHRKVSTSKWAQDYCPYCRAAGFKGIVGSTFKDVAMFGFKVINTPGGFGRLQFATVTDTTGKHTGLSTMDYFYETGTQLPYYVNQMVSSDYQVIVTKQDLAAYVAPTQYPYIDGQRSDGFILYGDANQEYDILVLGQIQY